MLEAVHVCGLRGCDTYLYFPHHLYSYFRKQNIFSSAGITHARMTIAPTTKTCDAARLPARAPARWQRPVVLTVRRLREVHVCVSQGATGDHVPAHPDGEHRAGGAELLVQHSLRDVGVQVANVERSHRVTPRRRVHISDWTRVNVKVPLKRKKKKLNEIKRI